MLGFAVTAVGASPQGQTRLAYPSYGSSCAFFCFRPRASPPQQGCSACRRQGVPNVDILQAVLVCPPNAAWLVLAGRATAHSGDPVWALPALLGNPRTLPLLFLVSVSLFRGKPKERPSVSQVALWPAEPSRQREEQVLRSPTLMSQAQQGGQHTGKVRG